MAKLPKKPKKEKTHILTDSQLKKLLAEARREGYDKAYPDAVDLCMALFMWALRVSERYGKKRLTRVMLKSQEISEYVTEKRLSTTDIYLAVEEETGINFMKESQCTSTG